MKDFILVFRTIFRNQNARRVSSSGKKKLSSGLTLVFSSFPLILFICVAVASLTITVTDVKVLAALMTVIVLASQFLTLFVSLYSVVNTMYSSSDISILNSLPLKPVSVFAAKFLNVYLNSYGMSALLIIPLLLTSAVTFNVVNGTIFYGIYPFVFVISLAAPLLPLFIIILFSMPITYLGSFFKGRPVLKSVLTILLYVILMSAYMVVVYYLNTTGFGQEGFSEMSQGVLSALITAAKVAYPDFVLVNFALGIEFGKNFGISAAISVCMVLIMLFLAFLFYRKITEKHLESNSGEVKKESASYKKESVVSSLISNDFRSVIRNPGIAMQSLANTVLAPIFITLMYFTTNFKNSSGGPGAVSGLLEEMMGIGFVLMYSAIFLSGTNMLAMIAYTREGEGFYITKSLPVSAKDSITAKLILSLIPSVILSFVIMLISVFLYRIDIVSSLLATLSIIMTTIGAAALHIFSDMKYGNLHWKTKADMNRISKGNKGSFAITMGCVCFAVIYFIMGIIMASFAESLGETIIKLIYWIIVLLCSAATMIAGLIVIVKKGESLYPLLGENRDIPQRVNRKQNKGDIMLG